MGFILIVTLAFALLGVYGLVVSVTHIFPVTAGSILWVLLAVISLLPILLFVKTYLEIFHPGVTATMSANHKDEPIVLNADVTGQLEPVSTIPATAPTPAANLKLSCRNVQLNVNAPHAIIEDNSEAEWLNAYWVQGTGNTPFMLVNDHNHIEVWSLTSEKDTTPKDKKPLAGLNVNGEWSNFSIVDAAPVTDTKLIIAVTFWDPRPDNALYLLDVTDLSLTPLLTKDAGYSRDIKYFQVKPLSGNTGIVLFYSKQVRTAAEIYHNYLNHLMLVSPKYPTGAEILKLGIDVGNVKEWDLYGHTIYIKTLDNRKPDAPKEGLWSLDLSGML